MNKLKLFSALWVCLLAIPAVSHEICMTTPFPVDSATRTLFYRSVRDTFSRTVPGLAFQGGTDLLPLSAGPFTWKIKRKRPAFGQLPELIRPRWKRERISVHAYVDGNRLCLDLTASAYNRKDKQWHMVTIDPGVVDEIMAPALLKHLEGRRAWILGQLPVPAGTVSPPPLSRATIVGARLAIRDMKRLIVELKPDDLPHTVSISIPYAGDVNRVDRALEALTRHLDWTDPQAGLARRYHFFWAYARHGELMDGMHERQVMVALGRPDRVVPEGADTETWVYGTGENARHLTIRDHELVLTE